MANHDYIIANQGFPSFRSDLNSVLQAVVSNNSSASEPSTKYAYQMWYETDTNKWYMRNADNDAWIQLALFNQTNDTVNFLDTSIASPLTVEGTSTAGAEIRLPEDTDNGSNYIALKSPNALSANVTLTLPTADGSTGQFLKTNGSGQLAFETVTSSGGDVTLNGAQTLTNKTLTAPKIGTSILDTGGNELALLTATSSAVNEFTVANAATNNAPRLSATGGDSNVDLDILAKGTGHVTIRGNTNSGTLQLNCEQNTHGQQLKAQPHSVASSAVSTLPNVTGELIPGKIEGTNFTDSLLVGHATTGTLNAAQDNTGVGIGALNALTSGDGNTAVGSEAGGQINSGIRNSLIGNASGDAITTGDQNTAVGFNSLTTNISSDKNTFLGAYSGENTTGGFNIGIGKSAGGNITSGSGNVVIGSDTNVGSATGSRQLVISGNDGSTATTWISGSSAGVVTLNAANVTQQALTSSSNAVAWDASAKPNAVHITTENTTFSAPSNNIEGAFICVEINYNGSHSIAWNTVFEFAASTAPTFTSADGKTDIMVFRYNGAVWQEVGRTINLSES